MIELFLWVCVIVGAFCIVPMALQVLFFGGILLLGLAEEAWKRL